MLLNIRKTMKRLLVISITLYLLTLCSCSFKETKNNIYINPINEANIYELVNDDLKSKLKLIYENNTIDNRLLLMIGKELANIKVNDYFDNEVNLNYYIDKNVVIEITNHTCSYCLKQLPVLKELNKEGITFIQYFKNGSKEDIESFYNDAGVSITNDLIIIPQNNEFDAYIDSFKINSTPFFIFYKKGKISFTYDSFLENENYKNIIDLAFNNSFSKDSFIDNDGNNVFDLYRSYDDVLDDLSLTNRYAISSINHHSLQQTIEVIGKHIEFNELYDKEKNTIYRIDSFNKYSNKELVVFYIKDNNKLINNIDIINDFIDKHKKLNVLTVLIDAEGSNTSNAVYNCKEKLKGDIVSSKSKIPVEFFNVIVLSYPSVLFIQDNTFMGGICDFDDLDSIEVGYNIFLGSDSIALKKNN